MKGGILAAFVAGLAIVGWRDVHSEHRIPAPGVLAGITGLFAVGALVADILPASAPLITAGLFGLDVAALLDVLPAGLGGQISKAETAQATAAGGGATNPLGGGTAPLPNPQTSSLKQFGG